jgi:hypothetical protein
MDTSKLEEQIDKDIPLLANEYPYRRLIVLMLYLIAKILFAGVKELKEANVAFRRII